jgi:hypothetical protein
LDGGKLPSRIPDADLEALAELVTATWSRQAAVYLGKLERR